MLIWQKLLNFQQPFHCEIEHKLGMTCLTTGPVTCRVRLDRGGYVPGEAINIWATIDNQSKVTIKGTRSCLTEVSHDFECFNIMSSVNLNQPWCICFKHISFCVLRVKSKSFVCNIFNYFRQVKSFKLHFKILQYESCLPKICSTKSPKYKELLSTLEVTILQCAVFNRTDNFSHFFVTHDTMLYPGTCAWSSIWCMGAFNIPIWWGMLKTNLMKNLTEK